MNLLGNLPDISKLSAMFDEDFDRLIAKLNELLVEVKGLRADMAQREQK